MIKIEPTGIMHVSVARVWCWQLLIALALLPLTCAAASYHVDAEQGSDTADGSVTSPWKSLAKINAVTFQPGDSILLRRGNRWTGQLHPKGSGEQGKPIRIDAYGQGAKPVIDAHEAVGQGVVWLFNQEYWEINNLELVNDAPTAGDRRGVYLSASNHPGNIIRHLYIRDCFIHNIKGIVDESTDAAKRTGGVLVETIDDRAVPTRFDDVRIENCEIATVDNIGIALNNRVTVKDYPGTPEWERRKFTRVLVRGNTIHDVAKNAMIIRLTDETGLIEHNRCYETAVRAKSGNTIFSRSCRGTVFQFNEGWYNRSSGADGSLYDADLQSPGCIFQYSFSHDNNHGLYWQCTAPKDDNVIVRYNVSQNDKGSIFCLNYAGAGTYIYNNTIYIGPSVAPVIIDERRKANKTYKFFNNIIYNASQNAQYRFFNGKREFSHNVFYGFHPQGEPEDPHKLTSPPLLVAPGAAASLKDLHGYFLQTDSPCIDSGMTIRGSCVLDLVGNVVPFNQIPDRGAFEWPGAQSGPAVRKSSTPSR